MIKGKQKTQKSYFLADLEAEEEEEEEEEGVERLAVHCGAMGPGC